MAWHGHAGRGQGEPEEAGRTNGSEGQNGSQCEHQASKPGKQAKWEKGGEERAEWEKSCFSFVAIGPYIFIVPIYVST